MNILVINAGSSSIKYKVFDFRRWPDGDQSIFAGIIDHLNESRAPIHRWHSAHRGKQIEVLEDKLAKEGDSFLYETIFRALAQSVVIDAVGHRVVHGGEHFNTPVKIDSSTLELLRQTISLAPLHNPSNISGIEQAQRVYFQVPHVAIFDTAFHHHLPSVARCYALPENIQREYKIRRYGFHGISHQYLAQKASHELDRPEKELRLVTLHLGNGASAAAINGGNCMDTSMGMTPLEGLIMGSRCGDIDAGVLMSLLYSGYSVSQLDDLLNKKSGLKGLCGENDLRLIEQGVGRGEPDAKKALDMYCYRIKKYIGAYAATLGGIDALVFSGGVGEHSAIVRQMCCEGLAFLGISLDLEKNKNPGAETKIHSYSATCAVLLIPANEELEIARQVKQYLSVT
ncbi:MAG: acetate kinase [Pseudomonadales bacterium]|nr:acetate kinase [Pseudomonadales bacterium]